jgi:hypothetical protein
MDRKKKYVVMPAVPATFLALLFSAGISHAQVGSDEFIAGYATAVLEVQFNIASCSVEVDRGVVAIRASDLKGEKLELATERLMEIPGVVRVVVDKTPAPAAPSADKPVTAVCLPPKKGTWLPDGRVFEPLFADPRWPHFSARYLYYGDSPEFDHVGAVSFGGAFPFYRGPMFLGGEWDIGIEGAVFSTFDIGSHSSPLINSDFWVAFPSIGFRWGYFSGLGRIFHQSSHLGDEYLLQTDIDRLNLGYDGGELLLSYELFGALRGYAGGRYLFRRSPEDLGRYSVQGGLQFVSPRGIFGSMVRPVAGVDLKAHRGTDWRADVSGRVGIQFESPASYPSFFQIVFELYDGHAPDGQFYTRKIEYLGIGLHYYQ